MSDKHTKFQICSAQHPFKSISISLNLPNGDFVFRNEGVPNSISLTAQGTDIELSEDFIVELVVRPRKSAKGGENEESSGGGSNVANSNDSQAEKNSDATEMRQQQALKANDEVEESSETSEQLQFNSQVDADADGSIDFDFEAEDPATLQRQQQTQQHEFDNEFCEVIRPQTKKRKMVMKYHHGVLTPLPPTTESYPIMNLPGLIKVWLLGSADQGITAPLWMLNSTMVRHFDGEGKLLSRMRRIMKVVENYSRRRGIWCPVHIDPYNYWNEETCAMVWDGVWGELKPHLLTEGKMKNGDEDALKRRCEALTWRTCHDKLFRARLFDMLRA